jgi:hypothetical protein
MTFTATTMSKGVTSPMRRGENMSRDARVGRHREHPANRFDGRR